MKYGLCWKTVSGYRGDRLTTQLSMDHNVEPVERLPIGYSNVKVSVSFLER